MDEEKKAFPSQIADRFVVRMPDGMREFIAERAKVNQRSMNSEIIAILDAYMSGDLIPAERLMRDPAVRKLIQEAARAALQVATDARPTSAPLLSRAPKKRGK